MPASKNKAAVISKIRDGILALSITSNWLLKLLSPESSLLNKFPAENKYTLSKTSVITSDEIYGKNNLLYKIAKIIYTGKDIANSVITLDTMTDDLSFNSATSF